MAQLLDLPDELLLDILDVIRVEDIEAFTSCNKRIHSLSEDALQKHRAMKKKYSEIKLISWGEGTLTVDVCLSDHPVFWLHEILQDEKAASYPTCLRIHDDEVDHLDEGDNCLMTADEDDEQLDRIFRILDEMKGCVYSKLKQSPYIQRKDLIDGKPDIYWNPSFETSLALLLTSLPNLRSIFIEAPFNNIFEIESVITEIGKANRADKEQPHALSGLVSFDYGHGGSERIRHTGLYLGFYLLFMGLPSIRSISGAFVYCRASESTDLPTLADELADVQDGLKSPKSGITNMKFIQSDISSSAFEVLLSVVAALQDFEYEYAEDGSHGFKPRNIVNSLRAYASHSLQSLDLTGQSRTIFKRHSNDDSDIGEGAFGSCLFMGSLRDFQVLKTVRVNNALFIEKFPDTSTNYENSFKVHRLVDLLPTSIEKLSLVGDAEFYSSAQILDQLVESKACLLPNMEEIKFSYFLPVILNMKQACHEVGVELVFPMAP